MSFETARPKLKKGVQLDLSVGKVLLSIVMVLVLFAFPARLYDMLSPQEVKPQNGNVAGIYTESYYNKKSQVSNNDKRTKIQAPIINFSEPRYSLVTIAGAVTITTSLILIFVYFHEEYKRQKYASPEL